jgi:hypothetical protein
MAVADHRVIFNRYGQEVLRESYLDELGPVLEASMVLPLDNCIKPLRHQPGLHRENRRSLATLYLMLDEALILSIPDRV